MGILKNLTLEALLLVTFFAKIMILGVSLPETLVFCALIALYSLKLFFDVKKINEINEKSSKLMIEAVEAIKKDSEEQIKLLKTEIQEVKTKISTSNIASSLKPRM